MVTFPNAKINIGLNITEKRTDGFHNIESVFYPVPCRDVLELIDSKSNSFTSYGIDIPGESTGNLCLKAYNLLKVDFDLPSYDFHLLKSIPIGAGLGGGSADGAFTLKLLNQLNKLNLSNQQLENYAKKLGSDCAFFIENKPKYCIEKGDVFEDINLNLSGKYLVLINPNIHISTAEAYANVKPQKPTKNLKEIIKQPIETWKELVINDFEKSLFPKYPIIENIKQKLYDLGVHYASMTGSGSTVYGLFETEQNLEKFSEFWTFQRQL